MDNSERNAVLKEAINILCATNYFIKCEQNNNVITVIVSVNEEPTVYEIIYRPDLNQLFSSFEGRIVPCNHKSVNALANIMIRQIAKYYNYKYDFIIDKDVKFLKENDLLTYNTLVDIYLNGLYRNLLEEFPATLITEINQLTEYLWNISLKNTSIL